MLAARVAPFAGRSGGFQARRAQQAPRRPALCIASLANGVAIGNHSNGNGAAMGLVNLEEQAVRDARGLCLSPLGQEAVQREINRQKATANKSPQKVRTRSPSRAPLLAHLPRSQLRCPFQRGDAAVHIRGLGAT